MAPVVVGTGSQPRAIVISPSIFSADEDTTSLDDRALPRYAVGLFESNGPGPRKRKRLTHLTAEEKVMRRKLKNRVAAQTARDRKKARIETLEEAVAKIQEQAEQLLDVNTRLLERTEVLEIENQSLRRRLGLEVPESFTLGKREELSIIKKEFSVITALQGKIKFESSDDEGFCVLTSCENNDDMSNVRNFGDVSSQETSKCVSPVPAAGSCQFSEADPLARRKRRILPSASHVCAEVAASTEDEPDISSLLRALEAVNPEQCLAANVSNKGNATRSSETLTEEVTSTRTKVPVNVFGDHQYTKPAPDLLYNAAQSPHLSNDSAPSMEDTEQIQASKDLKKPNALIEEPSKCTQQQLDLELPNELLDVMAPFPGNCAFADNGLQSEDFYAVLDNLMRSDAVNLDPPSEAESEDSGVASCDSPRSSSLLDTPSPFDCTDPFDCAVDCGILDGHLDLFPQLAAV